MFFLRYFCSFLNAKILIKLADSFTWKVKITQIFCLFAWFDRSFFGCYKPDWLRPKVKIPNAAV